MIDAKIPAMLSTRRLIRQAVVPNSTSNTVLAPRLPSGLMTSYGRQFYLSTSEKWREDIVLSTFNVHLFYLDAFLTRTLNVAKYAHQLILLSLFCCFLWIFCRRPGSWEVLDQPQQLCQKSYTQSDDSKLDLDWILFIKFHLKYMGLRAKNSGSWNSRRLPVNQWYARYEPSPCQ